METQINSYLTDFLEVIKSINPREINDLIDWLFDAYQKDKSIYVIGNGGSASTASHFAQDLGKGTSGKDYDSDKRRIKAISLTDNVSNITAYGNDLSFERIFEQQLRNFLTEGDILFSITGSGNSKNILEALRYAKRKGVQTISLLGFEGGRALAISDKYILVRSENYGVIEDAHSAICHIISQGLEKKLSVDFSNGLS